MDGDTVRVHYNGRSESVRLIGIDTPESVDPGSPVECFGPEASRRADGLLTNARIHLVRDGGQADRDRYGRLLRFVYLEDGKNFNTLLVEEGFATFEPQYAIAEPLRSELDAAEDIAMASGAGLWAACR